MKTAVVTASTKGIGKAIGISLLKKECFVFFSYDKDEAAAEKLTEELNEKYSGMFMIMKADLSSLDGMNQMVATVQKKTSAIDYLVLNTGTTDRTPFQNITVEEWNRVMDTNLSIPFFTVQKLANNINRDGRIIFIGSLMGQIPHAMSVSYGVSKAAIHFLSKSLVKEFCDERNITVNCIVPGFVDTLWQLKKDPAQRERIENKTALHRFALPEEIADLCMSIIGNGYINGAEINIDGGYSYK